MIITLIGYRGSGKSCIARLLAERLRWDWTDADAVLEANAGKTIREIFAESGEPEFRRLERETLVELLQRDRLIIASGGGAILNPDTRADFRTAGPVVWLTATVETLYQRIHGDHSTAERRPNLTTLGGGLAEIESLLTARLPLYQETATITLATDDQSPEQIVEAILQTLPADLVGADS